MLSLAPWLAFCSTNFIVGPRRSTDLAEKYLDFAVPDKFSSKFSELIKNFQKRRGLEVDGVIGPCFFRAFLTRYFFDASGRNNDRKGFEEKFFSLLSEEEYLRVISKNRWNDSMNRGFKTKHQFLHRRS